MLGNFSYSSSSSLLVENSTAPFVANNLYKITTICITAFYRVLGAFSKDMNVSIRMVFISLSVLALFAGYMQPFQTMKSWVYKWIYWANPIHYALEALMVNQLHGLDLDCSPIHLIPGVLGASIKNQGMYPTLCSILSSILIPIN